MFSKHVDAQITQTSWRAKAESIPGVSKNTADPGSIAVHSISIEHISDTLAHVARDGIDRSAGSYHAGDNVAIQYD